jgi:SAM-dependent methyltransferase
MGNVQTVLRQTHYPALSRWLAGLYPKEFRKYLKSTPEVGHVVYQEYSAKLQIELLQIDLAELKQPVLDIGCGSQANLVQHLRSLGIEVYGFDRQLEIQAAYLEQRDWFEYPFEAGKWGAIVSNMAFTNHLNYAYLHDVAQFEPYLLKMKEIIEALAAGGSFYYAPGLPFVEEHLAPERYKVEREQPASGLFVSIVTRI